MSVKPTNKNQPEEPVIGQVDFVGKDVLEIGSGKGSFTTDYLMEANSVVCVDPDSRANDWLRRELGHDRRFSLHSADIVDFPLGDNSFDIAVCSHSL